MKLEANSVRERVCAICHMELTELASFLALGLVDYTVGTFAHDTNDLVLVHLLVSFLGC